MRSEIVKEFADLFDGAAGAFAERDFLGEAFTFQNDFGEISEGGESISAAGSAEAALSVIENVENFRGGAIFSNEIGERAV